MSLRPTQLGLKGAVFLTAVVVVFLATPYSNLFFLLMAFLSVLALLGAAWGRTNLARIDAAVIGIAPAAAGATHGVVLRLHSGSGAMQAVVRLRVGGRWHQVASVPWLHGDMAVDGALGGLPRGLHRVEAVATATRYPLGICEWRRRAPADLEVISHPVPGPRRPGMDVRTLVAELAGDNDQRDGGHGVTGLRPFRTGDPASAVHWKASARRGCLVVKETEGEAGDAIEVVLDRRVDPAALEHALSRATAVLLCAAEGQQTVRLRSQDLDLRCGPDAEPVTAGLRWLAQAAPLDAGAPPPPLAAVAGALLLPGAVREAGDG